MSGFGTELEAFGGGGFFERMGSPGGGMPRDAYEMSVVDCRTQLRMCAQRIEELEAINVDLEARLEAQAREYNEFETENAEQHARWTEQQEGLERECESWRERSAQHELKNAKLRDQLLRTERELHGILQKKYDIMGVARRDEREKMRAEQLAAADLQGSAARELAQQFANFDRRDSTRGGDALGGTGSSTSSSGDPRENRRAAAWRAPRGNPLGAAPQEVRRGRAILALADFFGFPQRPFDARGSFDDGSYGGLNRS